MRVNPVILQNLIEARKIKPFIDRYCDLSNILTAVHNLKQWQIQGKTLSVFDRQGVNRSH